MGQRCRQVPSTGQVLAGQGASVEVQRDSDLTVAKLLDDLAELLKQRYGIKEFVRRRKPLFSLPAPPELVNELTASCDVVITGVGD
jgi:hypothetical protein